MNARIITEPGAYANIPAEDYHGREICAGPSISSTGLKTITTRSPAHYWYGSPLNPDRPRQVEKAHYAIGKAAHDMLLLGADWRDRYFVLPEDFNARSTKEQAAQHAERNAAIEAGLTILTFEQERATRRMADAIGANEFARASLSTGEPEVTLAWKDKETGVWLRARPDFLPTKRHAIPDLKTAADGSPAAFERAIGQFGYHQSAALYCDGIEAIFGEQPKHFFFVVVEKEEPHVVSLYELPADDIHRGRMLNRAAINRFADCLSADRWPGYADDVKVVGLPLWTQRQIDARAEAGELSYAA